MLQFLLCAGPKSTALAWTFRPWNPLEPKRAILDFFFHEPFFDDGCSSRQQETTIHNNHHYKPKHTHTHTHTHRGDHTTMTHYKLIIGNRNYSSWSLRAWLYLRASDEPCAVVLIPLYTDNYKQKVLQHSPSGRVPCLVDDRLPADCRSVWDSMAIMEHVLEQAAAAAHNKVVAWPADLAARTHARCIAMEMHSGFLALRDELPQNLKKINVKTGTSRAPPVTRLSTACRTQVDRVDEIWRTCLTRYGGTWLFGNTLTIADIMYIPVALRFVAYGVTVSDVSQRFVQATLEHPLVREWIQLAQDEIYVLDFIDNLVPAAESPLIL